jgi:F0F1-type ATP synthase assembly protein I
MSKKGGSGSKYTRFSTVGIQMGIIIGGFTWLGTYLDKKYQNDTPWWTIGLSLFGVVAGLYLMIKEVINMNKDDEK